MFSASKTAGPSGYNINNSLRFRSSASAYLSRTPASTTNRQTWTWSSWVKRGAFNAAVQNFFRTNPTVITALRFTSTDTIEFFTYTTSFTSQLVTTQVFRDPSAWYHIVLAVDTTQATAANRIKLYVNGQQVTVFSTSSYPSQNYNTGMNENSLTFIGANTSGSEPFDGYMAEVNFIDGQALTPSSFGSTNATTGVWQPAKYTGTYGTNGFYLKFVNTISSGFSSYYGSFNGSSQYLSIASCNATNFNTGDFTVEAWVYQNSRSDLQFIVGGSSTCFQCYIEANGTLNLGKAGTASIGASTGSVPLGIWTHVAYVRSGTTVTYYINGVASGTATDSNSYNLASTTVNIATSNNNIGSYDINGNLSNVRVVKGSAVYTSNFTPPTSNLTAVTNTSILTLQNATIIDNSTNAWSITNTGSVTMTSGTVGNYSTTIASDSSGNGNNWTPNNINAVTSGTTYDAMTDSPTNTSATVANYCVANPLDNSGLTISGGNLNLSIATATWYTMRASMALPTTGKYYWEYTVNDAGYNIVGILDANGSIAAGNYIYNTQYGYGWQCVAPVKGNNNVVTAYGSATTTGDVIMIAFDADNRSLFTGKNGTWFNSSNPATNTSPMYSSIPTTLTFFPAFGQYSTTSSAINFGQRPFAYTPPTGFNRLNTFNLPTSTIVKGNTVMDATLYTGNGATRSITNDGSFKPDFVWIKARSIAYYHRLADSVRGTGKELYSNDTLAETTNQADGYVSAFNSNGFSILGGAGVNLNANTFVAWQWQAGQGTTSSNTSGSITSTVSVNATAGFSIVTYTGNGSSPVTIGHGLGVAPKFIIIKDRSVVSSWVVQHTSLGWTQGFLGITTAAASTSTLFSNNTAPTSSVFTVGGYSNNNAENYVAYCWAEIAGFSKFGSYTGNGSTDGTFVYTGFRPKWIMLKRTDAANIWLIGDSRRDGYNSANPSANKQLQAQATNTESNFDIDYLSNGFKLRNTDSYLNASGGTYIYAAFAENPFKNALAR